MRDLRELPLDRILVSPSVLAADFTELAAEIDRAVQGKADLIHLDVMDGCFVPNISFGPPVIKSIRKRTELILDTHIMIEHPVRYAKAFAEAGSDHLTFHLECADPTAEAIEAIRQALAPELAAVQACMPEHILFLDASEAVLRARKAGDTTRSREFFAYYLNHLLPLKREWFREKKNVTFLSTDGLTARQVGEKVKHWCEQYI